MIEDFEFMLKYFRDRKSIGWLVGSALLVLVIFAFIAFYIPDFMGPQGAASTGDVAWVDGEAISSQEFLQHYRRQENQYRQQLGSQFSPDLMRQLGFDNLVVQELVRNTMLGIEAERQGLSVTDEELREVIMTLPSFQQDGAFIGQRAYLNLISSSGMSAARFEEELRKDILRQKLQSFVTDGIVLDPNELEEEYRRRNEQARIEYVFVDASDFEGPESTDEDAREYYEIHEDEFARPVQRKARFVTFSPQLFSASVTVTEREIERFYNRNAFRYETTEQVRASHILFKTDAGQDVDETRKRAEEVLAQARAGADFAELARTHSEDTSAAEGGDLGFFTRGQMVPQFENVAFSLPVGEVSDVVQTQFGFHIIKVTDREEPLRRPLDDVREEVRAAIVQTKASELMEQAVDSAAQKLDAAGSIDSLVASYDRLVPEETPWFSETDTLPQLGNSLEPAQVAFEIDVGEVSPPIRLGNGYAFLQVLEERPAGIPDFEDVVAAAKERWTKSQSLARAKERAQELRARLAASPDDLPEGVTIESTENFFRGTQLPEPGRSAALPVRVFEMPLGELSEPIPAANGYVIVRVLSRSGFSEADFEEQQDRFREQLADERRSRIWSGFLTSLRSRYTIRVDWQTIRGFTSLTQDGASGFTTCPPGQVWSPEHGHCH